MRQGQLPVNFQFKQSPPRLNDSLTPMLNDKVKDISRTSMNLENLLCLVQWGSSWLAKAKTRRGMHRDEGEQETGRKEASRACSGCGAGTTQCLQLWLSDLPACQDTRGQCGRRNEQGGSCHQPTGWISKSRGSASNSGVRVWL